MCHFYIRQASLTVIVIFSQRGASSFRKANNLKINVFLRFEQWWLENLQYFGGYPIVVEDTSVLADTQISSDAPGAGYFCVSVKQKLKIKVYSFYTTLVL